MKKFALYSKRVVVDRSILEATVVICDQLIEAVISGKHVSHDYKTVDLNNDIIMPGLIDAHVHINEPGRTNWEGFDTATKSAAAGGVTSLIDMPLNSSPVTTNADALQVKIEAAQQALHVNCGFYGGIIPGNNHDLTGLMDAGIFGIKAFLTHSGIDDFPNVGEAQLRQALPFFKDRNIPLLVHAELDSPHPGQQLLKENPISYDAYLKSRPKSWEDNAIEMMINLCSEFEVPVHIVHLSSANSIHQLTDAQQQGMPVSVETCPHYLVFNAEEIADGQTQYKCAPPIREKSNNEQLWQAIKDELITSIVTDHSPTLPALKELQSGDFNKAWGGIAGIQFGLPAFWTEAQKRGFDIMDINRLMSVNIARFLGIEKRKGQIKEGYDADLTIWNPEQEITVHENMIQHRHKVTPYLNMRLKGVVSQTYVRGEKVFDNGKFINLGKGEILLKEQP